MNLSRRYKFMAVSAIGAMAALAAACGGDDPAATPTQQPSATQPTGTQPAGTSTTASPTAAATSAPVGSVPDSKQPDGTLVFAWNSVPAASGVNQYGVSELIMAWGVSELFFRQSESSTVEPWLATEFTLAPDGSKVTVKFRDGVQFHKGYGELTADDIVWNLNNTNGSVNPQSIHGQAGDYAALFEAAVAVDKNTVDIPLKTYDVRFASYFMNQAGDGFGIFSKAAYDQEGEDWARDNIVATGPFSVEQWTQNDRVILKGVETHWDKAPSVDEIRILHIPEAQTRLAMMLNGEADLAPLEIKDLIQLDQAGFEITGTGRSRHLPLVLAGNYWETEHITTGEALPPTGAFNNDLPWVGKPGDQADLDEAKKVRKAISMAFDRETIDRQFFNDLATPLYMGTFFPSDPNYQDRWTVNYDPEAAKALLDEAGFPEKANGTRFDMPIFGESGNQLFSEMAEVAAGELNKIGINTEVLHYAYAVFRPTMVQRANLTPVVMTCRQNNGGAPFDWPRLEEYTSITRGGFGCGMEIQKAGELYLRAAAEPDTTKRIEINTEAGDYWFDEMFEPGIVTVPESVAYNPKKIAGWDMRPGIFLVVNSPENIELVD